MKRRSDVIIHTHAHNTSRLWRNTKTERLAERENHRRARYESERSTHRVSSARSTHKTAAVMGCPRAARTPSLLSRRTVVAADDADTHDGHVHCTQNWDAPPFCPKTMAIGTQNFGRRANIRFLFRGIHRRTFHGQLLSR